MVSPRVIPFAKEVATEIISKTGEIIKSGKKLKKATELLEKKPIKVKVGDKVTETAKDVETQIKVSKKDFKIKKAEISADQAEEALFIYKGTRITLKHLTDFNINKLSSRADIIKFIDIISKQTKTSITKQTRGVQTWENTKSLATALQANPEKLQAALLKIKPGETLNAEWILAARELLDAGMGKLDFLAETAFKGNVNDSLKFRQHLALMAEFQKILKGVQTETARAFNQFRIPTRTKRFTSIDLDVLNQEALLVEMGGVDEIRGVARLYLNAGTKKAKLKFTQETGVIANLRKASDSVAEIFINAILSSPITHIRNSAGNWLTQGLNMVERRAAVKMFGGTEKGGLAVYEDLAKAYGKHEAAKEMLAAISVAWRGDKVNFLKNLGSHVKSNFGGTGKVELRPDRLSASNFNIQSGKAAGTVDFIGQLLTLGRVPTKMLFVMDNWFKNQEYRSELYALAFREAMEKFEMGILKRENMAAYIADRVVNPTKATVKAAWDAAHYVTYQTKLNQRGDVFGKFGYIAQRAKNQTGFMSWLSNYYLPFVQTPTNIAGFISERTPGLAQLLTNYNKAILAGGVEKQMAITRLRLGSMFYAAIAPLGYFSVIGGSDIDIPGKATGGKFETMKALGIQANTIRIPVGDGKYWQINTTGGDPINMMLSMAANSGKYGHMVLQETGNIQDFTAHTLALVLGFGEILSNSTFLMGVSTFTNDVQNASKAMSGDIRGGEFMKKWFNKFSSSFYPGVLKQTSKLWTDDHRKLAVEWNEYMMRNISDTALEYDYNIFGEKIEKFGIFSTYKMTPAKEAFQEVMPRITPIDKRMTTSIDGISVSTLLKSDELRFLKRNAGIFFNNDMTSLVEGDHIDSELFLNENTEEIVKQMIIKKLLSKSRSDAKGLLMDETHETDKGTVDNPMRNIIIERLKEQKSLKILTAQKGKPLTDDNLDYHNLKFKGDEVTNDNINNNN